MFLLLLIHSLTGLCYHRAPWHSSAQASQFVPLSKTEHRQSFSTDWTALPVLSGWCFLVSQSVFYHQRPQKDSDVPYKWSIPCLFCSVSGQNVGEFLIFKYETISLPSVQMCLFPSLDRCMALRQHRGSCSQARWRIWWKMFSKAETLWFSLMESQMLGRPLHSSVCGSPSCPEVHHFLCQGKLLCSFVWKPSDWCHLVVDQCNSNKHSWLWVHCLQHWISSSCCLEPVLMNSIL